MDKTNLTFFLFFGTVFGLIRQIHFRRFNLEEKLLKKIIGTGAHRSGRGMRKSLSGLFDYEKYVLCWIPEASHRHMCW